MPTIHRVVPQLVPTVQRDFQASLGTHHDPRFLAPLAHLVDPDGPSGRIVGLVTATDDAVASRSADRAPGEVRRWPQRSFDSPVISRASEAGSGERPASRRHAGSHAQHEDSDPEVQRAGTKPPTLPTHSLWDGAAAATAVQRSLVTAPAPEPVIRALPSISHTRAPAAPPAADVTAQRQRSEPTPPAAEVPLTVLRTDAESPVFGDEAGSPPDATEPAVTNVEPQPRSLSDAPSTQPLRSEPHADQAALQARPIQRSMATPPIQRVTPPGSTATSTAMTTPRKLGLGPPIDRSPADATPVETISLQEWAAARDAPPPVQRRLKHAEDPPAVEAAPVVETALVARADAAPDSELPRGTTGAADDRSSPTQPSLATPLEPTHVTRSEPTLFEPTLATRFEPTLAMRVDPSQGVPARRTDVSSTPAPRGQAKTPLQRTHDSGRDPQRPEPVKHASVPAPLLVIAEAGRSFDAPARHMPPTSIQRLVTERSASPMLLVVQPAPGVPTAWTHPAPTRSEAHDLPGATPSPATVQRSALGQPVAIASPALAQAAEGSSLEPTQTTAGTRQPDGDTGAAAVAMGIAHRDADGSVVFAPPGSSTVAPNVQRVVQPGETLVAGPPDARADQPAAGLTPVGPPTAAHGVNPPAPHGALDIDDLARRLYDPLAARLKAELRLDRERAGLITDLRRP